MAFADQAALQEGAEVIERNLPRDPGVLPVSAAVGELVGVDFQNDQVEVKLEINLAGFRDRYWGRH